MTKKDYIKFAAMFNSIRPHKNEISTIDENTLALIEDLFADIIIKDNPRFDRRRFFVASGRYEETAKTNDDIAAEFS